MPASHSIHDFLRPGVRAHLVGIGGVSMAPLAEVLQGAGLAVSGSDWSESDTVARLRGLGIRVFTGPQKAENVGEADCVIRTAAARDDNPEVAAAVARGIPVFERGQAWGAIMEGFDRALCVAGTHGKTTTTAMCTHIAMAAGADPTVMLGGDLPLLGAGHRVGKGDTIILESCEYRNSFLSFSPTVAVILNIEADHLDFFKDLADIQASFRQFAQRTPPGGVVVANGEDENTLSALAGLERRLLTFGLERGDVTAARLTWESGLPSFDVMHRGEVYARLSLRVPGIHNVKNALAACAAAIALNLPGEAAERGLAAFRGAGRRFEYRGTVNGAAVYDDYAHHPSELEALFDGASAMGFQRVICAFQPHTYSRTSALFDGFARALRKPDVVVLAEIYAAREDNAAGLSSASLAAAVPNALFAPTLEEAAALLRELARPGDLILTVGAGDISGVAALLV